MTPTSMSIFTLAWRNRQKTATLSFIHSAHSLHRIH